MTRTLNSHSRRAIIILTRYPEPGAVKTRLVPALGPERAARLHGRMIEHTAYTVSMVAAGLSASCYLFFTGGSARLMKEWLGESFFYHEQEGESLGDRMHNAFSHVFKAGATEVVLTGTDCPELDAAVLTDAFSCMTSHDVVIGPAEDGGYYLAGLRHKARACLFQNISWGTASVLEQTQHAARHAGLSICYTPRLRDIDRPEDLYLAGLLNCREPGVYTDFVLQD